MQKQKPTLESIKQDFVRLSPLGLVRRYAYTSKKELNLHTLDGITDEQVQFVLDNHPSWLDHPDYRKRSECKSTDEYMELTDTELAEVFQDETTKFELGERVKAIKSIMDEIETLCDKSGKTCSLDMPYGMGGEYNPDKGEWYSSSSSC